jgi:hypothetical protein
LALRPARQTEPRLRAPKAGDKFACPVKQLKLVDLAIETRRDGGFVNGFESGVDMF